MQVHADYVLQAQIDTSQTQFQHFNYSTVQQHVVANMSHDWHGCYDHVVQTKITVFQTYQTSVGF